MYFGQFMFYTIGSAVLASLGMGFSFSIIPERLAMMTKRRLARFAAIAALITTGTTLIAWTLCTTTPFTTVFISTMAVNATLPIYIIHTMFPARR